LVVFLSYFPFTNIDPLTYTHSRGSSSWKHIPKGGEQARKQFQRGYGLTDAAATTTTTTTITQGEEDGEEEGKEEEVVVAAAVVVVVVFLCHIFCLARRKSLSGSGRPTVAPA
jgi:hypothetical protein